MTTNQFFVDYDKQIVSLHYKGQTYEFDLRKGDRGDFWTAFKDADGILHDINFFVEYDSDCPSLIIYELYKEEDGEWAIDSSDYEEVEFKGSNGNIKQYLQ